MTPICAKPRAAPPPSTRPMVGRFTSVWIVASFTRASLDPPPPLDMKLSHMLAQRGADAMVSRRYGEGDAVKPPAHSAAAFAAANGLVSATLVGRRMVKLLSSTE